jgi:hypothetical protein
MAIVTFFQNIGKLLADLAASCPRIHYSSVTALKTSNFTLLASKLGQQLLY